jgi:hypothetical protein
MSDETEERWLPIPWAPDYEVSDCANVRTTRRPGNHRQPRLTDPRQISVRGRGRHLYAYLPRKSDGKSRLQDVVRIMNAVFDGETMP